ncbi:sulfatase family protein [Ochrovirga pacifica]|uniref:sulfatase family protein n=1 Tax=Ochrovirga pacifica TaxID=1042376 RepID=UPI000255A2CD|nr:arylsulfatase [Ochrovirga pacifica]
MKINRLIKGLILIVCIGLVYSKANSQSKKPNVIVFIADDFGFGSTNVYGASKELIKTPNINKLADQGVRFTNAYTTGSVCTPTRYAFMTGEYSWRSKLKKGVVNMNDPALIDVNKKTLPKYMKSLGYQTAMVGKWHLGFKEKQFENLLGTIYPAPTDYGFDYSFALPNNLDDGHKVYIENNKIYGLRSDKICAYGKSFYGKQYTGYDAPQRVTENVTDDLTNKALEWLGTVKKDEPFFLYYAAAAVHHPIVPSPKMRGKSNAGAYGDFIQDIDRSLGDLIQFLEEKGIRENTIIVFASDNGGDIPNKKDIMPENFAVNKGLKINGDYKGDKHTIWDGGFRIPFIVNHPNVLKGNEISNVTVSTVDIYGFLADYIGNNKGLEKKDAPDSYSFKKAVLKPTKFYERPPLVHRDASGRKAIRFGDWKYIESANGGPMDIREQMLFNLSTDAGEATNVIDTQEKITNKAKGYLEKVINTPSKGIWKK